MLPFHKRSRSPSSSIIEIGLDDLEDIELPPVRSPHRAALVTPRPYAFRPSDDIEGDDEMTVVRFDKRHSSAPPPPVASRTPAIPLPPRRARFDDDEPTMGAPGSQPLLSMSSRKLPLDRFEEPSRSRFEPPRSSRAVDAAPSNPLGDLSMTSSVSMDVGRLRRGPGWALGFTFVGVLAGLIVALALRGDGLAAVAAFVDPTHNASASVAKAIPQADVAQGAAAPQQSSADKPPASSCNADAVAAAVVAKVEAHGIAPAPTPETHVAKPEPKSEPAKVVQPPPVARTVDTVAYVAPKPAPAAHHYERPASEQAPNPPPPARRGHQSDLASASEADALAKAQLDAALTR